MLEIRNDVLYAADVPVDAPLELPEGLRGIAPGVFRNRRLSGIRFPSTLTEIGDSAFEGATAEEILLPDSLRVLGRRAFYGSRIARVSIPSGVGTVPEECFAESNLETAEVGSGIVAFADGAFRNAFFLQEISIPGSLAWVGEEAFLNCRRMSIDLVLPETCRCVGGRAFYGSGIHQLSLPEDGCEIGPDAFAFCWDLQKITVPYREEYAGDFYLCLRGSDCLRVCDVPDAEEFAPLVRDRILEVLTCFLSTQDVVSSESYLHYLLVRHNKKEFNVPQLCLRDVDLPEERRMTAAGLGITPETAYELSRKKVLQFPDTPNRLAAFLCFARPDTALTERIYDDMTASGELKDLENTVALISYRKKTKQSASLQPLLFA